MIVARQPEFLYEVRARSPNVLNLSVSYHAPPIRLCNIVLASRLSVDGVTGLVAARKAARQSRSTSRLGRQERLGTKFHLRSSSLHLRVVWRGYCEGAWKALLGWCVGC
jgi:hypothetical protein